MIIGKIFQVFGINASPLCDGSRADEALEAVWMDVRPSWIKVFILASGIVMSALRVHETMNWVAVDDRADADACSHRHIYTRVCAFMTSVLHLRVCGRIYVRLKVNGNAKVLELLHDIGTSKGHLWRRVDDCPVVLLRLVQLDGSKRRNTNRTDLILLPHRPIADPRQCVIRRRCRNLHAIENLGQILHLCNRRHTCRSSQLHAQYQLILVHRLRPLGPLVRRLHL
mmetsp:Transcript_4160/g.12512  ORF Transcript_4160/g.12512 Transcript_4160/m.12512 type:complete len:226 (-) Transcript_4160:120-797(-)